MIASIDSGARSVLLLLLAASGAAQELTEAQAIQLLRESPSVSECRGEPRIHERRQALAASPAGRFLGRIA